MNNIYITTQKLRELGIDDITIKNVNTVMKLVNNGVVTHNYKIMVMLQPDFINTIKIMDDRQRGLLDVPVKDMIEHMKEFHEFDSEILNDFMSYVYDFIVNTNCISKNDLIKQFNLKPDIAIGLISYIRNRRIMLTCNITNIGIVNITNILLSGDFDNKLAHNFMLKVCDFLLSHRQGVSFSKLNMIKSMGFLSKDVNHIALMSYLINNGMVTQSGTQYKVTNDNRIIIETYKEILNNEK